MTKQIPILMATLGAVALLGTGLVGTALAQGPAQPETTPLAQSQTGGQRPAKPAGDSARGARGHISTTGVEVLARLSGLTADEIRSQVQAGQSLAQIAEAKGIARDRLIAEIVAIKTTKINDQVKAGTLTQARADEMLAKLAEQVAADVDRLGGRPPDKMTAGAPDASTARPQAGKAARGGAISQTGVQVLAELTGMTAEDIVAQVQTGQSLAQVAETKGIAKDKLIAEIVAAKTTKINDQVKAGRLTQEKADETVAKLTEQATADVERTGSAAPPGNRPARGERAGATATPAATN